MHLRVAVVLLLLAARGATAKPVTSCRDLAARSYAELDARAQTRLPGKAWARAKAWPTYVVDVQLARAPHLAREILAECPGVTELDEPRPTDARRLASTIRIRVASFAALSRILQLPAVGRVVVIDPTLRKRQMLDDPMFDVE